MIIGVTGIIGSGKSTAAGLLSERLLAKIIDADKLGHQVLRENKFVRFCLLLVFGSTDRKKIAGQVFSSQWKLFLLNKITHPFILRLIRKTLRKKNVDFILDAPLLFQSGLAKYCDIIIFVAADEKNLRKRLRAKGYTDGQIAQRLAANAAIYRYQSQAVTLLNNGSVAQLRRTLEKILR